MMKKRIKKRVGAENVKMIVNGIRDLVSMPLNRFLFFFLLLYRYLREFRQADSATFSTLSS